MSRLEQIRRSGAGAGGVALVATLSFFLAALSVAAFLVVRTAERDRWTSTALQTVISLENALKAHAFRPGDANRPPDDGAPPDPDEPRSGRRFPRGPSPEHLQEILDQFEPEGVRYAALVGREGRVFADTDRSRSGTRVASPALDAAFASHEVRSGESTTADGEDVFDVFVPMLRPPRPGRGAGPLFRLFGDEAEQMVVMVGVTPTPTWLWNWVWAQAAASAAVIFAMWAAMLHARHTARQTGCPAQAIVVE